MGWKRSDYQNPRKSKFALDQSIQKSYKANTILKIRGWETCIRSASRPALEYSVETKWLWWLLLNALIMQHLALVWGSCTRKQQKTALQKIKIKNKKEELLRGIMLAIAFTLPLSCPMPYEKLSHHWIFGFHLEKRIIGLLLYDFSTHELPQPFLHSRLFLHLSFSLSLSLINISTPSRLSQKHSFHPQKSRSSSSSSSDLRTK